MGSAQTYRHTFGRTLNVEAKFIIPEGTRAQLLLRKTTSLTSGYAVSLKGGEDRHHMTYWSYGYDATERRWMYTETEVRFTKDCSIPTDDTEEPQLIRAEQDATNNQGVLR